MNPSIYEYRFEVVEDKKTFQNLRAKWNNALAIHGYHHPFLCHEWFSTWIKHFLDREKLMIILVSKEDRLVAIAPLIVRKQKIKGLSRITTISLIGNVHSPVRSLIFACSTNQERIDVLMHTLDFLLSYDQGWDVLELDSLPTEDGTFNNVMRAISLCGLRNKEYSCFGDWYLDGITCTGEDYLGSLPSGMRQEIRRRTRRLKEVGELEFKIGHDMNRIDEYIQIHQQVRRKSWKSPERDEGFHQDIRRMLCQKGWLRFGFLFLDKVAVASQIRIVCNGKAYFMSTLYDQQYRKYSPGTVLLSKMTRYLIDTDRVNELDNVKGDESYKKDWTPKRRERKGVKIFNKNVKGRFLGFLFTTLFPNIERSAHGAEMKKKISNYLKCRG